MTQCNPLSTEKTRNFWKTYESKWIYSADLFNKIISFKVACEQDWAIKEGLKAALACDLLHMGMWNHESFSTLFKDILLKSIKNKCDCNLTENCSCGNSLDKIDEMNSGALTLESAQKLITNFQGKINNKLIQIQEEEIKKHEEIELKKENFKESKSQISVNAEIANLAPYHKPSNP